MKSSALRLGTALFSILLLASAIAAPPPTPQNLRPAWLTIMFESPGAEPFVIWESVPEAESYSVYRADDGNTNWTLVVSNLTVPFFGDPLAALLPSYYTVTAVNADGESPGANPVSVFEAHGGTLIVPGPAVEHGTLSSSNAVVSWITSWAAGDEALLQWGPADPPSTNYPFYFINTNYLGWHNIELTNLAPLTPYQYRVTSISGNRGGLQWSGAFITPDTNYPPVATFTAAPSWDGTNWFITLSATDDDAYMYWAAQMNTFRITSQPTNGTLIGTLESQWYTAQANLIYQPAYQARGEDRFTFVANDGFLDSIPVTVVITNWVNTAPVLSDSSLTTLEDTSLNIELIALDAEGDPVSFVIFGSWGGTLSGTVPNLTFTPDANYSGDAGIGYMATDGYENSYASVYITVSPVNDPPLVEVPLVTTVEDSSVLITPLFTDPDTSTFTTTLVTAPTNGTLEDLGFGYLYYPTPDFYGVDSFTFVLVDADDGSTSVVFTASIAVLPVNDLPQPNSQAFSTGEDTPVAVTLSAIDADGDPIVFALANNPTFGTLTGSGANFVYTPAENFNGTDSFEFTATDSTGSSGVATVTINVAPVNDAPVANNASATTAEDTAVALTLSGSDADGDLLSFNITAPPTHGVLSGTPPNVTYTPTPNFNGSDSFTFTANDGVTDGNIATVSLAIVAVNDAPVAAAQAVIVNEDGSVPITLSGADAENTPLTFAIVNAPVHGTLSGSAPNLVYTPTANYNGPDSFTFTANDGMAGGAPAAVTITVTSVNDAPVAAPQAVTTSEDIGVSITVVASDVDGNALTYALSAPSHGTISGTAPNLFYTPAANYNGPDTFTFQVNDGSLNSAVATVSIAVTAVNDAPVANAQSVTVTYNTAKTITLTGNDLEGSALTYSIVTQPTNGTLSGTTPNVIYTPNVGSAGADRFTFRANDGSSDSVAATVSITTQNPSGTPAAPSVLTVTVPTATGTLNLAWNDNSTNEDGFKIERSANGTSGWTQIVTVGMNVRTFSNTGLPRNTRFYYRVRAFNRLGNSVYSNIANGRTR